MTALEHVLAEQNRKIPKGRFTAKCARRHRGARKFVEHRSPWPARADRGRHRESTRGGLYLAFYPLQALIRGRDVSVTFRRRQLATSSTALPLTIRPSFHLPHGGRHCLIDEARVLHRVSFPFRSYVCRSDQSLRYQAACVRRCSVASSRRCSEDVTFVHRYLQELGD